jgi:predicted alpha-1,2-mannosidase
LATCLLLACLPAAAQAGTVLIEAESFVHLGGWVVDQQSMDVMGSPFLLAHGLGKPVADAHTAVTLPERGTYRLLVRTRDWVAPWHAPGAPGKFQVVINGQVLPTVFGAEGADWHWQDGGRVEIADRKATVALHDLTGFEGRCDAILLTTEPDLSPPNKDPQMARFRRKLLGLPETPEDGGSSDLVVVGGGIAGTCAAVSAARLGLSVTLIQDRPVLGGNNSSEVRVWLQGARNLPPYRHVGDIVRELEQANRAHYGPGNTATLYEDEKKIALVRAEKNVRLVLNHRVIAVETGGGRIRSVVAHDIVSGRSLRFSGRWFADCTGDGCVGFLAKADWEMTVPGHMGGCNLWNVIDTGKPAPFPRCPWALDLGDKPFPGRNKQHPDPLQLGGWYWESGFDHDPLEKIEYIRDWNFRAMYGAWDALKNVDGALPDHKLNWAAYVEGKRESRRLLGDLVLAKGDLVEARRYPDGCVPTGWQIDIHRPDKRFERGFEGDAFISQADFGSYPQPFWIPYRCLYSRNVPNLFMAGRCISVTHEALGAVRVMRTGGCMGECVGRAASLCKRHGGDPRDVYGKYLDEFVELLRRPLSNAHGKEPVDYADPLVDSAHSRWIFFSSACRPFAMVNLSPDTNPGPDAASDSGYCYHKGSICGLSHVHAWQLGGVSVMPVAGAVDATAGPEAFRSPFRHDDEVCQPGYHAVTLDRYRIRVELTSTPRVGFHRYRFPAGDDGCVAINLAQGTISVPVPDAMLRQVGDAEVEGYQVNGPTDAKRRSKSCTVYFVARFDRPVRDLSGWIGRRRLGIVREVSGKDCGAIVRCALGADRLLQMKVGLSYVSIEQARRNLDAELPHWDFDRVRRESREVWNQWLGKIEVEGGSDTQRKKFYTDLWHALLGRRLSSDVDGKYCDMTGPAPRIRQIPLDAQGRPHYNHYNSDAFWMTFWNLNQLWGIAYPRTYSEFVRFLLDMYRDGGLIPRGPTGHNYSFVMIAAHSTPLIVGAYMKGIRDFDAATAYEGMRKNHFPGGLMGHGHYEFQSAKLGGIEDYLHYGYVPIDGRPKGWIAESASATLEYAYDDWCLAQMARALGREDDGRMFLRRAENYRNLFDRESGFMRPRRRDGSWLAPFDPLASRYWCETNAWQFTWFVPHDVEGLIRLMGGRETFSRRLNDIFERSAAANFVAPSATNLGYLDYSNQPSMATAHLFNYAGAPWLAQKWVREVKEQTFGGATPDLGYRGDEDQGQAGALGVMMAIGLFQVRGGAEVDPVYEITSPIFDRVTVHLDPDYYPGRKFVIVARNNSRENRYIQSAALNGRPLTRPWFYHRDLVHGGTLELVLGPEPNKRWGSRPEDAPPSMTPALAAPRP